MEEQVSYTISFGDFPPSQLPEGDRAARLRAVTSEIDDLPALSTVGISLIDELVRPDTSIKKLSEIISADPVVAAKVLRHANSAYYGISNKIQTVRHAISMLGTDEIKEIAFNLYFYSLAKTHSKSGADIEQRYLQRSLATGTLCKKICSHYHFQSVGPGEAYLAGLLLNIGIFLLLRTKRNEFLETLAIREAEQIPLFVAEERVFGFNHAELGGWFAEKWNLPISLQETIRCHHRAPDDAVNQELLAICQLADVICNELGVTLTPSKPRSVLDPISVRTLENRVPNTPVEITVQNAVTIFGSICLGSGDLLKAFDGVATETPVDSPMPAMAAYSDSLKERKSAELKPDRKPQITVDQGSSLDPSILISGLGQWKRGRTGEGVMFFTLFCLCIGLFFATVGTNNFSAALGALGAVVIWTVQAWDLLRSQQNGPSKSN